ncbi:MULTISPECIES: conjugal transfer nickase/helicase domain-containing protein [Photorhabdus]|uniref:conjugal transfer nickase/helicase domain-containing protein n=1 Tax=Photorhabdus TaxID=29487 RepID=UPI00232C36A4|nr:DNA-binding domain-containing protein [Photorhabdus bodei]MDB6370185.1 DNA-binding domain-containing protein [Photorhabdus bodei]
MLKKINILLAGTSAGKKSLPQPTAIPETVKAGYFLPSESRLLLDTSRRRQCLQCLWDNSALPKTHYQALWLAPLHECVALMQQLPAAPQGSYAHLGGLIDVTLQCTAFAVRLAKGQMLPPGVAPETQAEQSVIWSTVVFYAALFHFLPVLAQFDGELDEGQPWYPGLVVPQGPYRFRFKTPPVETRVACHFGLLLAGRLLPAKALTWLASVPHALPALFCILSGDMKEDDAINQIMTEALNKAGAPTISEILSVTAALPQVIVSGNPDVSATPLSTAMESVLPSQRRQEDNPMTEIVSSAVKSVDESTQQLLSLMGMNVAGTVTEQVMASEAEIVPPDTPVPSQHSVQATLQNENAIETSCIGEQFWDWLSAGLRHGVMTINTPKARIHLVSGFVFVSVPAIFFQFLSEKKQVDGKEVSEKWKRVQTAFERLGRHRVSGGKCFCCCHLYDSADRAGSYQRIHGYLIKNTLLYRGHSVPEDSPFLMIS